VLIPSLQPPSSILAKVPWLVAAQIYSSPCPSGLTQAQHWWLRLPRALHLIAPVVLQLPGHYTTKEYFPIVAERLNMKISTNQHLTTMLTGHGNIKSYLYRFRIITSPACPCSKNDQTTDHLLYECELLKIQRHCLKIAVSKSEAGQPAKTL
jgi:hypothetical protein